MKRGYLITIIVILLTAGSIKAQKEDIPNISTIKYLWGNLGRIFGNSLQREFIKLSESGKASSLNNFFKEEFDRKNVEKKNKIIKKMPATYYLMRAIAAHSANDETTEFYSYSLFLHVINSRKGLSRKEKRTLGRMKFDGFNLYDWTTEAVIVRAKTYQREKDVRGALKDIEADLKNNEKEIKKEEDTISNIEAILDNKEGTKKYKLDTRQDPTYFCTQLHADVTTLVGNDGVGAEKAVISPDLTSYPVGCYLDNNIRQYVNIISNAVNNILSKDPRIKRGDVQVGLVITGKADGRGKGKRITTYNSSSEQEFGIISKEFKLIKGWEGNRFIENRNKTFNPERKPNYEYYNYELAFLRAYASFKLIEIYLTTQNIKLLDGNFSAIEYEERSDTCRGVVIQMTVSGLLKHYERDITKLKQEIANLTNRRNALIRQIDKLREELNNLKELFDRTNEGIKKFDRLNGLH